MVKKNQPSSGTRLIALDRLFISKTETFVEKGEPCEIDDPEIIEKLIELGLVEYQDDTFKADEVITSKESI